MTESKDVEFGREFRFAWHIEAKSHSEDDYHVVKEQVHYKREDGSTYTKPVLRVIKNFKRPVWFTKPNKRTHKDKREFERKENLNMEMCRQSDLKRIIALRVNDGYLNPRTSIRDLAKSPFVYGGDIPSSLFLRETNYIRKYPNLNTQRTVAMFDTETDVLNGTEEIIIATTCFQTKAMVVVQKSFLEGFSNVKELFEKAVDKHLKKYIEERGLEINFIMADTEIDLLKVTFEQIHRWRPDFLAIWNIDFDVTKILAACKRANIDPKDILCDPNLPEHLKVCKYHKGITKKESASGVKQTIKPANQWHVLELTASFYVICAMSSYRRIRGGPELGSYSLDATLKREEIGQGKINLPEAEKFKKLKWHQFMQRMRKFDYLCYAIFDAYSMLLLDEKTKDLCYQLPLLADNTTLADYSSQARRQRDNFFLYGLKSGIVLGTAGPVKKKTFDKSKMKSRKNPDEDFEGEDEETEGLEGEHTTLGTEGWVVTLRAYLSEPGLFIIEEDENLGTLIRTHVFDNDVVSSYPNCIFVANVSKYSTAFEITGFFWKDGPIPERVYRMQNLNFAFGRTNHAEWAQTILKAPCYLDLRQMMLDDLAKEKEKELV